MKSKTKKVGRPSVMTATVVRKLETAFAIDATAEEACSFAGISRDTFYNFLKEKPEFSDKIDGLRQQPILKARQTIVESLDNSNEAKWYLERKLKKEFSPRQELGNAESQPFIINITDYSAKNSADQDV